jgi:hypothetical protein
MLGWIHKAIHRYKMKVDDYIAAHIETLFHIYEGSPYMWISCRECGEIVREDFICESKYNPEHNFCSEYCLDIWEEKHSHDYQDIA